MKRYVCPVSDDTCRKGCVSDCALDDAATPEEEAALNRNTGGSRLMGWQDRAADLATMESTGREGCLACTHLDGGVFCEGRPRDWCLKSNEGEGGTVFSSNTGGGGALRTEDHPEGVASSNDGGESVTHSPPTRERATCRVCGRTQPVEDGALADHPEAHDRFSVCPGSGEEV